MKFKGLIWILGSLSAVQAITERHRGSKTKPTDFAKNCSHKSLVEDTNGHFILHAHCKKWSNLDLGQCYSSENGVLKPQDK